MYILPLTQNKFALIDDTDTELVALHKWHYDEGYACTSIRVDGVNKKLRLHHFLLGVSRGVDHRDRNGLNNQRGNLRLCTRSQNQSNRGLFQNNKSGHSGIRFRRDRYLVQVVKQYKAHHIGSFASLEDAITARNDAKLILHGEFASR